MVRIMNSIYQQNITLLTSSHVDKTTYYSQGKAVHTSMKSAIHHTFSSKHWTPGSGMAFYHAVDVCPGGQNAGNSNMKFSQVDRLHAK